MNFLLGLIETVGQHGWWCNFFHWCLAGVGQVLPKRFSVIRQPFPPFLQIWGSGFSQSLFVYFCFFFCLCLLTVRDCLVYMRGKKETYRAQCCIFFSKFLGSLPCSVHFSESCLLYPGVFSYKRENIEGMEFLYFGRNTDSSIFIFKEKNQQNTQHSQKWIFFNI